MYLKEKNKEQLTRLQKLRGKNACFCVYYGTLQRTLVIICLDRCGVRSLSFILVMEACSKSKYHFLANTISVQY